MMRPASRQAALRRYAVRSVARGRSRRCPGRRTRGACLGSSPSLGAGQRHIARDCPVDARRRLLRHGRARVCTCARARSADGRHRHGERVRRPRREARGDGGRVAQRHNVRCALDCGRVGRLCGQPIVVHEQTFTNTRASLDIAGNDVWGRLPSVPVTKERSSDRTDSLNSSPRAPFSPTRPIASATMPSCTIRTSPTIPLVWPPV